MATPMVQLLEKSIAHERAKRNRRHLRYDRLIHAVGNLVARGRPAYLIVHCICGFQIQFSFSTAVASLTKDE